MDGWIGKMRLVSVCTLARKRERRIGLEDGDVASRYEVDNPHGSDNLRDSLRPAKAAVAGDERQASRDRLLL